MLIGVNLSHDYAHCRLADGRLTLVEEERRSRVRYHWDASSYTLACLDRYDLDVLAGADAVALNSPNLAKLRRDGDLSSERRSYRYVGDYPEPGDQSGIAEGRIVVDGVEIPAVWVSHYHAHALSTHWASGYDAADVFCLDGTGDFGHGAVFAAAGGALRLVHRITDAPLGSLYHRVALRAFDGAGRFPESKLMALAAYGRAELSGTRFLGADGRAVAFDPEVRPSVHDVAAFQDAFEEAVLALIAGVDATADALCLAGGCFYNVPLNRRIAESGSHARVFIPPYAGDMGTAIGAALMAAAHVGRPLLDRAHAASPYLGDELNVSADELRALVTDAGDVPVFHTRDPAYAGSD